MFSRHFFRTFSYDKKLRFRKCSCAACDFKIFETQSWEKNLVACFALICSSPYQGPYYIERLSSIQNRIRLGLSLSIY